MKPKPFASLNHFTVPVAMRLALLCSRGRKRRAVSLSPGAEDGRKFCAGANPLASTDDIQNARTGVTRRALRDPGPPAGGGALAGVKHLRRGCRPGRCQTPPTASSGARRGGSERNVSGIPSKVSNTSDDEIGPGSDLEQQPLGVLDALLDPQQELHGLAAVDEPVVVAQSQVHHRTDDDLTVPGHRAL